MSDLVKLKTYTIKGNDTFVEEFQAKEWDDFVFITLPPSVGEEQVYNLADHVRNLGTNKVYIFIQESELDAISFFGVTQEEKVND